MPNDNKWSICPAYTEKAKRSSSMVSGCRSFDPLICSATDNTTAPPSSARSILLNLKGGLAPLRARAPQQRGSALKLDPEPGLHSKRKGDPDCLGLFQRRDQSTQNLGLSIVVQPPFNFTMPCRSQLRRQRLTFSHVPPAISASSVCDRDKRAGERALAC